VFPRGFLNFDATALYKLSAIYYDTTIVAGNDLMIKTADTPYVLLHPF